MLLCCDPVELGQDGDQIADDAIVGHMEERGLFSSLLMATMAGTRTFIASPPN